MQLTTGLPRTGHGYWPDSTGTLRDVDRFNASWGNGAGGIISTTRAVTQSNRTGNAVISAMLTVGEGVLCPGSQSAA